MSRHRKLSAAELSLFWVQIGMFLRSGVPLTEGLALLRSERAGRRMRTASEALYTAVGEQRRPLSEAMEGVNLFPRYAVAMVRVGEQAGNLDEVADALATFYQREHALSQRLKSAVTYPLILLVMLGAAVFFLVTRVLPMFRDILRDMGGELPGAVTAMLHAGRFLERNYLVVFGIILAAAVAILAAVHTQKGALLRDNCKAKLPLFRKLAAARFAGAMGLLLSGGVSMDSALDLSRELLHNRHMAARLDLARRNGSAVDEQLSGADIFPAKFTKLFEVGVRSGETDAALARLAELYEHESNQSLDRLTGSVEPILSAVLSVIVGVILVSVIVPLIEMMRLIG